jgi:hypothetical protein
METRRKRKNIQGPQGFRYAQVLVSLIRYQKISKTMRNTRGIYVHPGYMGICPK